MSQNSILDLVIKYSKSMGYDIQPKIIPLEFVGSKFKNDKDSAINISKLTLPSSFEEILK